MIVQTRGALEPLLHLEPGHSAELAGAAAALAELSGRAARRLAGALDGIWLGETALPGLAALVHLCAADTVPRPRPPVDLAPAAGRRIVIGSGPHVSGSLAHHAAGHALCGLDRAHLSPEWARIMRRCAPVFRLPHYAAAAEEWWAESYALVATGAAHRLFTLLSYDDAVARLVWNYHAGDRGAAE
ncbi:hypothetical protein J5X84_18965 [Streptosporangiaceae bacterium NEAU-GS5]|nr:hypothetical protein [Streptosporangiaceae bacterium NEAU-GS5]